MSELTPIEKAQAARQAQLESGESSKIKSKWEKWEESNTRKSSIEAFCEHCMGGPDTPGYRTDIRECTSGPDSSLPCPLWNWRPYK